MMRIIRVILIAVVFLTSSYTSVLLACSPDVTPIVIENSSDTSNKVSAILAALASPYEEAYFSESRNAYELCFDIIGDLVVDSEDSPGFSGFNIAAANDDLVISGLKVQRGVGLPDVPFISITNNSFGKVTLEDVELSNVVDGIATVGSGPIEIKDSIITGDESKSGKCISIASEGAIVKSSVISSCGEGVHIAANNALLGAQDRAGYNAEKNIITGNGIGIHVVSGSGNKFAFNNVYNNQIVGLPVTATGIAIDDGANGAIAAPVVIKDDESGWSLRCETNDDGMIVKREIWFQVPSAGRITLYISDHLDSKQAVSLYEVCEVSSVDGKCLIENPAIDGQLPEKSCMLPGNYLTAMFSATSSSQLLLEPIDVGIGVIVAPPVTTPSPVPSHLSSGGDQGGIIDDGGSSLDDDDMSDSGGNSMGGDSIGSGMGGMAKCTLTENSQLHAADLAIMIILLLSTIVPMAVVNSMQRAPSRVARKRDRSIVQ